MKFRYLNNKFSKVTATAITGVLLVLTLTGCGNQMREPSDFMAPKNDVTASKAATEEDTSESGVEVAETGASDNEALLDSEASLPKTESGITLINVEIQSFDKTGYDSHKREILLTHCEGLSATDSEYKALNKSLKNLYEITIKNKKVDHDTYLGYYTEDELLDYQIEMLPFSNESTILTSRNDTVVTSFRVSDFMFLGGAHPSTENKGYCFDTQSGKRLFINDVVNNYDGFVTKVIEKVKKEEKAEYYYEGYEDTIKEILDSEDPCWYFDRDGLHVIFDTYTIGFYALGPTLVDFFYDEDAAFIKDEYLLSQADADILYPIAGDDITAEIEDEYPEVVPDESGLFAAEDISEREEDTQDYIIPDSDKRMLTMDDIKDLKQYELKRARNEIYARKGRIFSNSAMARYFQKKEWYEGTVYGTEFDDSTLSKIEQSNAELIHKRELELTDGQEPSKIESQVVAFLSEPVVNGMLNMRFDNAENAQLDVRDIVYQMTDETVKADALSKSLMDEGIEIECDLSYASTETLKATCLSLTGYELDSEGWSCEGMPYDKTTDCFYFDHGDTNAVMFIGELWSVLGDTIAVKCYPYFDYDASAFIVTLEKTEDGGYKFISIR